MVKGFLGNTKAANHKDMVEAFLDSFHAVGCSVSINVPFLKGHLNEYPANLGDMGDEHRICFHQDIKVMEERYQGQWNTHGQLLLEHSKRLCRYVTLQTLS